MIAANITRRFIAFVIDIFILLLVVNIPLSFMEKSFEDASYHDLIGAYFGYISSYFFVYSSLMLTRRSQATIGQELMGLRVTKWDGNKLGFIRAALNAGFMLILCFAFDYGNQFLLLVCILNLLPIFFNDKNLLLHNYICKTIVVKSMLEKRSLVKQFITLIYYYFIMLIFGTLILWFFFIILIMSSGGMH